MFILRPVPSELSGFMGLCQQMEQKPWSFVSLSFCFVFWRGEDICYTSVNRDNDGRGVKKRSAGRIKLRDLQKSFSQVFWSWQTCDTKKPIHHQRDMQLTTVTECDLWELCHWDGPSITFTRRGRGFRYNISGTGVQLWWSCCAVCVGHNHTAQKDPLRHCLCWFIMGHVGDD